MISSINQRGKWGERKGEGTFHLDSPQNENGDRNSTIAGKKRKWCKWKYWRLSKEGFFKCSCECLLIGMRALLTWIIQRKRTNSSFFRKWYKINDKLFRLKRRKKWKKESKEKCIHREREREENGELKHKMKAEIGWRDKKVLLTEHLKIDCCV